MLDGPCADGLRALQIAQERATAEELMQRMKGFVARSTAALLMADAVGRRFEPPEEQDSSSDEDET